MVNPEVPVSAHRHSSEVVVSQDVSAKLSLRKETRHPLAQFGTKRARCPVNLNWSAAMAMLNSAKVQNKLASGLVTILGRDI